MDYAMSPMMVNMLDTWIKEFVNRLVYNHLPKQQVKLKDSFAADHLLFCNHSASYSD